MKLSAKSALNNIDTDLLSTKIKEIEKIVQNSKKPEFDDMPNIMSMFGDGYILARKKGKTAMENAYSKLDNLFAQIVDKGWFQKQLGKGSVFSGDESVWTSIWDKAYRTKNGKVASMLLKAGGKAWRSGIHWRHTAIGGAMFRGEAKMSLALASGMSKKDIQGAQANGYGFIHDLSFDNLEGKFSEIEIRGICSAWAENGWKPNNDEMVACAAFGTEKLLKLALDFGGDPMSRDNDGKTLLHLSCGDISVDDGYEKTSLLVSRGADVQSRDNDGNLPIDVARVSPERRKIVDYLSPRTNSLEQADKLRMRSVSEQSIKDAIELLRNAGYVVTKNGGHGKNQGL